ncbi:hypothetical protein Tco_0528037 [Tanacetum coccineum]
MATTDKESSAAGMDNRPPMLEESDFESWKIRIERVSQRTENNKERADIQAYKHLINGPTHIFNTLNKPETKRDLGKMELLSNGGKYVTIVKNSKDISTVSYVDLYTHLKSYEQHALKTLSKMNQTSGNTDPLAYIAKATQSTSSPSQYVPPPPQYAPAPQQAP